MKKRYTFDFTVSGGGVMVSVVSDSAREALELAQDAVAEDYDHFDVHTTPVSIEVL